MKGAHAMLVKAKGNVRDAAGWHKAGEVFHTDTDFGDAVEVLDAQKPAMVEKEVPVEAAPVEEVAKEPNKAKTTNNRRRASTK